MEGNSDLKSLLDRLPPFIQKGNKLCKLIIWKDRNRYVMKYSNATDDLLSCDTDLAALASRILQKLYELEGTRGYTID